MQAYLAAAQTAGPGPGCGPENQIGLPAQN